MSTEIKRKNHFVIPIAFAVLSRTGKSNENQKMFSNYFNGIRFFPG